MVYDHIQDWPEDPHRLFKVWMRDAEYAEINDPTAMCLATVGKDGMPSARMVLLKSHDDQGFVFFTNSESRKGQEIKLHAKAALCFYWKSLKKQVRIEGRIEQISTEQADRYFNSRHRNSRIGAWASKQSRAMNHRQDFEERIAHYEKKFHNKEEIPRPPHWTGYRILPSLLEFWMDEKYRLHRRCEYKADSQGAWTRQMLYP